MNFYYSLRKIVVIFVVQSSDCGHNYAESVSLFSKVECRKFYWERLSGHSSASYHLVWRGAVAYFIPKVSYNLTS